MRTAEQNFAPQLVALSLEGVLRHYEVGNEAEAIRLNNLLAFCTLGKDVRQHITILVPNKRFLETDLLRFEQSDALAAQNALLDWVCS